MPKVTRDPLQNSELFRAAISLQQNLIDLRCEDLFACQKIYFWIQFEEPDICFFLVMRQRAASSFDLHQDLCTAQVHVALHFLEGRRMNPDRALQGACILVAEDNAILALELMDSLVNAGAMILGPAATLAKANSASLAYAVLDVNSGQEPETQVLTKPAPLKLSMRTVCGAHHGVRICAIQGCRYC